MSKLSSKLPLHVRFFYRLCAGIGLTPRGYVYAKALVLLALGAYVLFVEAAVAAPPALFVGFCLLYIASLMHVMSDLDMITAAEERMATDKTVLPRAVADKIKSVLRSYSSRYDDYLAEHKITDPDDPRAKAEAKRLGDEMQEELNRIAQDHEGLRIQRIQLPDDPPVPKDKRDLH